MYLFDGLTRQILALFSHAKKRRLIVSYLFDSWFGFVRRVSSSLPFLIINAGRYSVSIKSCREERR